MHWPSAETKPFLAAALDNRGEDVAFLEKWGYDAEQKQAIGDSVYAVAEG